MTILRSQWEIEVRSSARRMTGDMGGSAERNADVTPAVDFIDGNTGTVVGEGWDDRGYANGVILKTTDGGVTWAHHQKMKRS